MTDAATISLAGANKDGEAVVIKSTEFGKSIAVMFEYTSTIYP